MSHVMKSAMVCRGSARTAIARRALRFRSRTAGFVAVAAMAMATVGLARPASAQIGEMFGGRATVLTNATVMTPDGPIENANVVIRRGAIASITTDEPQVRGRTQVVDASGLVITPGLIDVHGTLGLTGNGGGGPRNRASDAFDRYDTDAIERAWRGGVTMVYIPARGGSISGTGAVMKLGSSVQEVDAGNALCIDLDSGASSLARLGRVQSIRQQFKQAIEYRESREIYADEQLPEYEKKLAEQVEARKKKEAEEGADGEKKDSAALVAGDEDLQPTPRRRRGGRPGAPPAAGRGGGGGGGGEAEEARKPREPRANRAADVLLRAIDREIPVRIVAHRSADILNAIALGEEFGLRVVIEGGHEAGLVADALAAADVSVVMGPAPTASPYGGPRFLRFDPHAPAALAAAGVDTVIGSGVGGATPYLLMNAQLVASHAPSVNPLNAVTVDAARFLGLPDHGAIRRGGAADLVLWSGDPHDPGSSVVAVMIDGRTVFGTLPE
ncbi:MAG: hypothetical protein AB8G96_17265 [Phycisphaerales bacterium]